MSSLEFQIHSRLGFHFNSFSRGVHANPAKIVLNSTACFWSLMLSFGM
jgi:hypothetical protein